MTDFLRLSRKNRDRKPRVKDKTFHFLLFHIQIASRSKSAGPCFGEFSLVVPLSIDRKTFGLALYRLRALALY